MDLVREVCSAAHSIRKATRAAGPPAAGPLTVAGPDADRLAPFVDLIADEVNVKRGRPRPTDDDALRLAAS